MGLERWEQSAEAWIQHVDEGDGLRETTLDPLMIGYVLNNPNGVTLDLGCGEGRFCRMLTKRGLKPLGIEITPSLLARAKRRDSSGYYAKGSATDIPVLDASVDCLITYIVLVDVPDIDFVVKEATRVLKSGGRWIDASVCPFRTSAEAAWIKDSKGRKLHVPVVDYAHPRPVRAAWKGIDVINYHRPLSAYWRPFLKAGLRLVSFEEPTPSPEKAEHEGDLRIPLGMISIWQKV